MFLQNIFRATNMLWGLIISISIHGILTGLVMKKSLLHHVLLHPSFMAQAS